MNTIVVAGCDTESNPFTKLVTDYGFKALHVPDLNNKDLPRADAAIVAVQNAGHGLVDRVKKTYPRVLFSKSSGASGVKQDFLDEFVEPLKRTLEGSPRRMQVAYFVAMSHKVGSRVVFRSIREKLKLYFDGNVDAAINNWFSKSGMAKRVVGKKGIYIFLGLTEEAAQELQSLGLIVPKDSIRKTEEEELESQSEAMESKSAPPAESPKPEPVKGYEELNARLDKQIAMMDKFMASVTMKQSNMHKHIESISNLVGAEGKKTSIEHRLHDKINRLKYEDLVKVELLLETIIK